MALRAVDSRELEEWRTTLLAAARDIRKARSHLHVSELPKVELEANLAVQYMEYLRQWAIRAEHKAQSSKRDAKLTAARDRFLKQS